MIRSPLRTPVANCQRGETAQVGDIEPTDRVPKSICINFRIVKLNPKHYLCNNKNHFMSACRPCAPPHPSSISPQSAGPNHRPSALRHPT